MAIQKAPVPIFYDTVLKLSINQGLEVQRTQELLASQFTMGELAYTRDTGRVFVGDFSDGEPEHFGYQETIGGSLVGNKYLGLIDSKPLAVFEKNGEPLAYETTTSRSGTQEYPTFIEQPLLLDKSKYRLKSPTGAVESWSRWDRQATYNDRYNAYNGDYMFDIYRNALILFDNRISGDLKSPSQPKIKKDANGVPVSPETFIMEDGTEIASTNDKAIALQRRTTLQNYLIDGKESPETAVYGDGYVIMRILEPDNKTIVFKKRAFTQAGIPQDGANISHNILELGEIPFEKIKHFFSDDFTCTDMVYLHKEIKNVKSISPATTGLKLPSSITFSKPYTKNGVVQRGMVGEQRWNFVDLTTYLPQMAAGMDYKVALQYKGTVTDDKDNTVKYPQFDVKLKEDTFPVDEYYIRLEGLVSNQEDPTFLHLDERATSKSYNHSPVLSVTPEEVGLSNFYDYTEPYNPEYFTLPEIAYSNNFGITSKGRISEIDTYHHNYYEAAKDKIDRWEEQNPSTNFIRKPITILASSDDKTLYPPTTTPSTYNMRTLLTNVSGYTKRYSTYTRFNSLNLLQGITGKGQLVVGTNNSEGNPTWGVTFNTSYACTVQKEANNGGSCFAFSLNQTLQTHMKTVTMQATLSGFGSNSSKAVTAKILLALFNASGLVTYAHTIVPYGTGAMTVTLDIDEDVTSDCYLVAGFMGDTADTINNTYTLTINNLSYTYWNYTVDDEFINSKCGVNVLLDYIIEPYLYCSRKLMSSPMTSLLPAITNIANYPNKPGTAYFNSFSNHNIKTWNNLVTVMGHNHYLNVNQTKSNATIIDGSRGDTSKAQAFGAKSFMYIDGIQYTSSFGKVNNNDLDEQACMDKAIFSWAKIVSNLNGQTVWTIADTYDTRYEELRLKQGTSLSYIKLQPRNVDIMNVSRAQIKAFTEVDAESSLTITNYYLMPEDDYLSANSYYVEFGGRGEDTGYGNWSWTYDLVKNHKIDYLDTLDVTKLSQNSTNEWSYSGGKITQIRLINGTSVVQNLSTAANIHTFLNSVDGSIGVDDSMNGTLISNGTLLHIKEADPSDTNNTWDSWFPISANVMHVVGAYPPATLSGAKIKEANYAAVTINEEPSEANKVYLPYHAKTVLLEMTHVTTDGNTVGVFYANEFEDLGITLSGLPTSEFTTAGAAQNQGLMSTGTFSPLTSSGYSGSGTSYSQLVPSTRTDYSFHDLAQTLATNTNRRPSVYWANTNEKTLALTNHTERTIIEVPIQTSKYSGYRHFALRLANVRPTTTLANNYLSLRVVGYTV